MSTCSAPLVQTGERKQFSLLDLDLLPFDLFVQVAAAMIYMCTKFGAGSSTRVTFRARHTHTYTKSQLPLITLYSRISYTAMLVTIDKRA